MEFHVNNLKSKSTLAIVVTYNPEIDDFKVFCNQLLKQFVRVIIVDNNSKNIELISSEFKLQETIIFIKNLSNLGLASAQNQGIRYAIDNDFPSFCIFDQDSQIEDGYLEVLVNDYNELTKEGRKVATIGPVVLDQSSGEEYPAPIYKGLFLKRHNLKPLEVISCSYIIASGSLYDTNFFIEIGMFKDQFFINYIDVEWCFRATSLNYEVFMSSNCKLVQNVGMFRKLFMGRSIPVHNPIRRYYATRNSILMFYLPHVSVSYKIREFFLNPFRLVFDCLVAGGVKQRVMLFLKGYIDGIKNI